MIKGGRCGGIIRGYRTNNNTYVHSKSEVRWWQNPCVVRRSRCFIQKKKTQRHDIFMIIFFHVSEKMKCVSLQYLSETIINENLVFSYFRAILLK